MLERRSDMARVESAAPGKAILFGEHAVVYGRSAIAVPVTEVVAVVTAESTPEGNGIVLVAPDLKKRLSLSTAPENEPLALAARLTLIHLSAPEPNANLIIRSTIPIASGLGSGTAVTTALIRALAALLGHRITTADVSDLVFEVEKLHHGTPSGIDNTVIAYEQPIYYMRGQSIERLNVREPFGLLIGDTGIHSHTKDVVNWVRQARNRNPARYDALFDQIGDIVDDARMALETADLYALGLLMDDNHELLVEMGVSSTELDEMVEAARFGGAMGAKLSGAGRGGHMIALVEDDNLEQVTETLNEAGAKRVIYTRVNPRHTGE
jgi:mevalonate kinase